MDENQPTNTPDASEETINVVNPKGDLVAIPKAQLDEAINHNSYRMPSDSDISSYQKHEKYGTLPQQLGTGLESGLSAATFGASRGVERGIGSALGIDALSPENQKGRQKENPASDFGGSAAGLIIPSLLTMGGSGAASILGKAGVAGAERLGLGAATSIGGKLAAGAVKGAIEAGLFQGGNEVGKMLLSDSPEDAVKAVPSALINMGLAVAIGAPLGAGLTGLKGIWGATIGKNVASSLEGAADSLSGEANPSMVPSDQAGAVESGIADLKPNAPDLKESFSRLGIKPSVGALSDSPFIQNMEGNLGQRPSFAGVTQQRSTNEAFKVLNKNAQDLLRDATTKSEAVVGSEIKKGLVKSLESELDPIEEKYATLKDHFQKIEVPSELKDNAKQLIDSHEYTKLDPKFQKIANGLTTRIDNISDVNDLKNVRSLVNDELREASRKGAPEAKILQTAKNALTDMRASSIETAASSGSVPESTLNDIKEADQMYASYKNKLKSLGVESGTGDINNARSMLDRFGKLSDESFATRIFDTGDINQLKFFKENFPEQFDLARRYKLASIAENSVNEAQGKNGKFEVGRFLRQVSDKNLGPEARAELFNGTGNEKLQDIRNVYGAIPGAQNTSNTSYAEAFAKIATPAGLLQNAADAVQYAMLRSMPYLSSAANAAGGDEAANLAALNFARTSEKGVDAQGFKSMADFMRNVIKGESAANKATSALFDATKDVLPSHLIPDQKDRDKLDKHLKDLQTNNAPMLNVGDQVGSYMPAHSAEMAQTTMNAVNTLNALRPQNSKKSPLDESMGPTPMQKAQYERTLDIAQQPLMILTHIKDGTLSNKDLQVFKGLYPGMHASLSEKITHNLMDTVHKNEPIPYRTRMGLSLFLGQPLDSTMSPQSIMAAQPKQAQQQSPMQQQEMPRRHDMKSLGKLASANQTPLQARQASRSSQS